MSNTDMSNDPDELRRDIERTRENLSQNVNALGEAVDPGAVAKRQVEKVQDKVMGVGQGLKEKVMGSDDDYGNDGVAAKFGDAGDKVGELAGSAKSSVENAPAAAKRKAQRAIRWPPVSSPWARAGCSARCCPLLSGSRN